MSRTVYVDLDEGKVVARCLKEKIGISAIERLPGGGVRLVCMSSDGAERVRHALKSHVIGDQSVARERHRPSTPLW
jgi:hypothetical protein